MAEPRGYFDRLLSYLGWASQPGGRKVPVFVMLPLDFALDTRRLSDEEFHRRLSLLADAGATGVMVDVWWGLCEPKPRTYRFQKYKTLADQCAALGLKIQATMSFHQCGGNVGDDTYIPLPEWVVDAGDEHETWFTDKAGRVTREYISFGADELRVFAGRTPREMYAEFMEMFCEAMGGHMGTTVTELQVGVGPCGELRYPSYPMSRWTFPGIGEFQCYDKFLVQDLQAKATAVGHPEWGMPPQDAGVYNSRPMETGFFKDKEFGGTWVTERGQFFLQWYSECMLLHGDRIVAEAHRVLSRYEGRVALAVKIAGIHWWYRTQSHAAELTAGYNNAGAADAYALVAKMLQKYNAVFDFTCLEMYNRDQPDKAMSAPENLVRQVLNAVKTNGLRFAGENALERYDSKAFHKMLHVFKEDGLNVAGFTYLRFTDRLFSWWYFWNFSNFVSFMNNI